MKKNEVVVKEMDKRGVELAEQIVVELSNSVSSMTKVCMLVGEFNRENYDRKELINMTGLSAGTVTKMVKASDSILNFIAITKVDDAESMRKINNVSYACYYDMRKELADETSFIYDDSLSFDEKVEVIATCRTNKKETANINTGNSDSDSNVVDGEVISEEVVENDNVMIEMSKADYEYFLTFLNGIRLDQEITVDDMNDIKALIKVFRKGV